MDAFSKVFQEDSSDFEDEYEKELGESFVINPNFMIGHQYAVERLLRDLVNYLDEAECYKETCDWAAMSHLYIYDKFHIERDNKMTLVGNWPNSGIVNTNDVSNEGVKKLKYFKEGKVLDEGFQISPVVMNLKNNEILYEKVMAKASNYVAEVNAGLIGGFQ